MYGIHCFYTIYTKITSQLLLLPDQQGDCLQRIGEREHVHAHALRHAVTLLLKVLQVPDQRLGITGDVDDPLGADLGYGIHEFFGAAASGGIHQDHIDLRSLSGHLHEEFPGVVLVELDVADLVRLGIVAGIPDSIGV